MKVDVPLRLGAGLNDRLHWRARRRQWAHEKTVVGYLLGGRPRPPLPVAVTVTRVAPSRGLDDDNLAGASKAVRDAVAAWLRIDDRDERISFRYHQERGPWAVRINLEPR
jgi:hypothetical protein